MTYSPETSPNLYLSGLSASGISGYKQLLKGSMPAAAEVDLTQTVVNTDGEKLMQAWVSPALGITEVPSGGWYFPTYASVDTVSGTSEIIIRYYLRSAAGTETKIYNLTTGALAASAALYTPSVGSSAFPINSTDRLVVKYFAKTSSTTTRTIHLYYLGAARQTRVITPMQLAVVPGGDMLAGLYDSDLDGQIIASMPTFSGAMLTKSGTQSINATTYTAITFDGEVLDTDNYHSNSTNTTRLTAPSAGYYLVGGSVAFENLADAKTTIVTIYKNGSAVDGYGQTRDATGGSGATTSSHITVIVYLAAGDYVEIMGYQNDSTARNCRTSANGTSFWIMKVG